MKEKGIENKIKNFLSKNNAYYVKYFGNAFTKSGVPDILVCYNGRFIGIEVKNEHGKTSLLQDANLRQIKKAGGIGIVARTVSDVEQALHSIELEKYTKYYDSLI